jgi:hypothetical protein
MAGAVDPTAEARRHFLAALAYEAEARGLVCRLTGPGETVLHVAHPATGRGTMVLVVPSSSLNWSYLWGGGGLAAAADPSRAADLIAGSLGR